MKGQKILIPALFVNLVLCLLFIWLGLRTLNRHADHPGNWHFIAALIGSIGFAFLLVLCIPGFYAMAFPKRFQKLYSQLQKKEFE